MSPTRRVDRQAQRSDSDHVGNFDDRESVRLPEGIVEALKTTAQTLDCLLHRCTACRAPVLHQPFRTFNGVGCVQHVFSH